MSDKMDLDQLANFPFRLVERRIVVCGRCSGTGRVDVISDDPRYKGPWLVQCPLCQGSGRRVRVVTTEHMDFHSSGNE